MKKNPKKKEKASIYKNPLFKKLLLIFLFIAFAFLFLFPRSIDILNGNPLFTFDQGREYLAAKGIVDDHKLILIGTELGAGSAGINGLFHGPIYYYFLTIPYVIFGGNPAGGTVLIFLFNLACVGFLFYFAKKIFGLWPAIVAAFLFAISPIFVSQARFLWSPNPPGVFILLSLYFTYLFYKKRYLYVFLSSFFAAFVYNFEMAIAIPMSVALFIYSIFYFRTKYKNYIFLILGFVLGFSPMLLFELRHDFIGLRGLIDYLTVKSGGSGGESFVFNHFNSIIYSLNDTFGLGKYTLGLLSYVAPILLFVSTIYYFRFEENKQIKHLIIYFGLLIVTTFFVFMNLRNALYVYYLTDLCLIYIILFSYLVYSAQKKKHTVFLVALIIFVAVKAIFLIPENIKTSIYDYSDYGGTAKLKGKVDALDFIYKDAKDDKFGLLVFTPPVYTYPFDYVIDWYGKEKYGYVPPQEKKGTFYLLIEPDPAKPWSYKGWLETVIKDGEVVFTKKLDKSGFIVQKREIVE